MPSRAHLAELCSESTLRIDRFAPSGPYVPNVVLYQAELYSDAHHSTTIPHPTRYNSASAKLRHAHPMSDLM